MEKLQQLAIEAKNKKNGERDSFLDAWAEMVKCANSLRPVYGSQAVNKVINIHYYNFTR